MLTQIEQVVNTYPLCSFSQENNVLVIRNSDSSPIGTRCFGRVELELEEIIRNANRAKQPKQSKCLVLTRTNSLSI